MALCFQILTETSRVDMLVHRVDFFSCSSAKIHKDYDEDQARKMLHAQAYVGNKEE